MEDESKIVSDEPHDVTSPRTAEKPGPQTTQDDGCCGTETPKAAKSSDGGQRTLYTPTIISFILLVTGMGLQFFDVEWFQGYIKLAFFVVAYLPVGGKVLLYAAKNIAKGEVFNEFFLMGIATLGAFYIGEYAEGVAVMLFYVIGEHFQEAAVFKSRRSIKSLIDNRPNVVNVVREGGPFQVNPETVRIGEVIHVNAGEKVALDGEMLTEESAFNTAALTGESKPDSKRSGDKVLAGMVNLSKPVEIKVTSSFEDSALSRILAMVEEASNRKAKTQKFITRFAKVYTPIVVFLAVGLTFLPYFFVESYVFEDWLYRALVFLVISCPCALVISIPLGYFGGIGAASKNGILFKGSNFLDLITKVNTVVMDKTGTLTKGIFRVQQVVLAKNAIISKERLLALTAALEKKSAHPIAKAVVEYTQQQDLEASEVEEISGHGLKGVVDDLEILAGNSRLLHKFNVAHDPEIETLADTMVFIAINGQYTGYIKIADEIKMDAATAIKKLHALGIKEITMLSGDNTAVVKTVADTLGIDKAYGNLLPADKVSKVEELKKQGRKVAFVGDGINDAPVITVADVGMAMGGLGSDAAIETADVVIQTDQPSKIATAVKIGKETNKIVWQNIGLAFGVKAIILILGAFGLANLWEAVFADVGVAFLAILNAVRIQRMKF